MQIKKKKRKKEKKEKENKKKDKRENSTSNQSEYVTEKPIVFKKFSPLSYDKSQLSFNNTQIFYEDELIYQCPDYKFDFKNEKEAKLFRVERYNNRGKKCESGGSMWADYTAEDIEAIAKNINKELNIPENSIVLDAGTGCGQLQVYIQKMVKTLNFGVDISDVSISWLNGKFNGTNTNIFCTVDLTKWNFETLQFDYIFFMGMFVHFTQYHKEIILDNLYRMLKKGGTLLITYSKVESELKLLESRNFTQIIKKRDYDFILTEKKTAVKYPNHYSYICIK